MSVSETAPAVAKLGISRDVAAICAASSATEAEMTITLSCSLESPSFAIEPSKPISRKGTLDLEWSWLLRPMSAGQHAMALVVAPDGDVVVDFRKLPFSNSFPKDRSADRILVYVNVLTSLGLTAAQDAWAKAVGTIIGVAGVILGFPFLKVEIERRKERKAGRRR